ncbi:GNAT family N-acetyltransferase [uncultured Pseudokineococcus sp.]|uniref:GNAT family N-acetyltransferase n=1 Tax=uncultured Pseudokineococcus sp. TaxID=1642928 RepID=UPI0026097E18|nr:GNAT family N-acetyltransferase [uncultured Pseudokineococcus sp.]
MHPTTRRGRDGDGARARVRLHPLAPDDVALRAALVRLEPAPHQLRDSASARQTLPAADADPRRAPFAVLLDDEPIGFGVLDRGELLARVVDEPERAVLLRGFYLAASAQGRGRGRAAAAEVPRLAARLWGPVARGGPALVVLTVATGNAAALRAYTAAGYVATGVQQRVEGEEPQHVLVAAVPQPGATAPSGAHPARRGAADRGGGRPPVLRR